MTTRHLPSAPKPAVLAVGILIAVLTGYAQELTVEKSAGSITLTIKRSEERNYLLTRSQPMEFSATGPAWIRVYTRMRWHDELNATGAYEILVDSMAERIWRTIRSETLQTAKSSAARGPNNEKYSRWRSVFVRIPAGQYRLRLRLGFTESETIAVRLALEAPQLGKEIRLENNRPIIRIRDDTAVADWYLVRSGEQINLTAVGPARLLVAARLGFHQDERGPRELVVRAYEDSLLLASTRLTLRRSRQSVCLPADGPFDFQPSIVRHWRLELPAGEHRLVLKFESQDSGSKKMRSGAFRFFSLARRQ